MRISIFSTVRFRTLCSVSLKTFPIGLLFYAQTYKRKMYEHKTYPIHMYSRSDSFLAVAKMMMIIKVLSLPGRERFSREISLMPRTLFLRSKVTIMW